MPDAAFAAPGLTIFARLDELGIVAVGQRPNPDRAVLECRVVARDEDAFCRLRPGGAPGHHGGCTAAVQALAGGGARALVGASFNT